MTDLGQRSTYSKNLRTGKKRPGRSSSIDYAPGPERGNTKQKKGSLRKVKIKLVIPGKPLGKQRPRVMRNGHTYTPDKTVNYETLVKQLYITEHFQKQLFGPIKATITAYMYIPKSESKKRKEKMLQNEILPCKMPDWDNIGKIITDALNGLAYEDDKQIVDARVVKLYSDQPRVEVQLEELETIS